MILGCSVDSQSANASFAKKHDFPFSLLCDTDRKVAMAYGATDDPSGKAQRMSVLIGEDGKIARVWPPKVNAAEHPAQVLSSL